MVLPFFPFMDAFSDKKPAPVIEPEPKAKKKKTEEKPPKDEDDSEITE